MTTYKVFGRYIYNTDENFTFGITNGVWSGSNDSYTSDWFDVEKGYTFLLKQVVARMRQTYMKDLQNAAGPQIAAAETLAALENREARNAARGRIRGWWGNYDRIRWI